MENVMTFMSHPLEHSQWGVWGLHRGNRVILGHTIRPLSNKVSLKEPRIAHIGTRNKLYIPIVSAKTLDST